MFSKKVLVFAAVVFMFGAMAPAAYAHRSENEFEQEQEREHHRESKRFGFKLEDSEQGLSDFVPRGAVHGVLQTKTDSGFTVKTRKGKVYTVTTANATIVKLPNTTISLADLAVGDFVSVLGVKTDSTVSATKVFVMPLGMHRFEVKGSVQSISGDTIKILTKKGYEVTVKTSADTQVRKKPGNTQGTLTDVVVGSSVQVKGVWDSTSDTMNATRIKIK